MEGIITKGIGGFYYIKAIDENIYECKARGIFRKEKIKPMIGDRVDFENGAITKIYPRKTMLVRPAAANVDMMMLVVAATSPEPNLFLLDKMLITAQQAGIEVVLCINKSDLVNRDDIEKIYSSAGYKVIFTNAEEGVGTEEVRKIIDGRITAFAGLSGVGKSTLLSRITGLDIETGEISDKISRGKHTTRHVELFSLGEDTFVLDTPGFSSLEINDIKSEELWKYFPEMADSEGKCRFRGCIHINEPDCEIKKRLSEGEISQSRYENYKELYKKLKEGEQYK